MQMTLKKTAVVSNQHDASANERLYNQVGQQSRTAMSPGHASSGAVRSAQSPTYEAMPDNFGHTAGDVVYTSTPVDDGATYEAVEAQQPASSDLYATVARPGARGSAYSTLSTANSDLQQSKLALSETCVIRCVHPRWHNPVILSCTLRQHSGVCGMVAGRSYRPWIFGLSAPLHSHKSTF